MSQIPIKDVSLITKIPPAEDAYQPSVTLSVHLPHSELNLFISDALNKLFLQLFPL